MDKHRSILSWILAIVLLIPLMPLYIIGFICVILATPLVIIVGNLLVLFNVSRTTLSMVLTAIKTVCFAPARLFMFAGNGLAHAFPSVRKENE